MNMKFFIPLVVVAVLLGTAWTGGFLRAEENRTRYAENLDDIHAASCRVYMTSGNGQGAIGSGTVIALIDGKYWVITNWHVVSGFRNCELHFFREGKIFKAKATIQGTWHNERAPYDFAVLTVPESELKAYNPPIVPLAPKETKPLTDRPIYSSGCPEGRWASAWKGSIETYYGDTAQFYPAPKQGQSGSSIVQNIDGRLRVTGILTWRVGDERNTSEENMRGGAIPISKFYDAASGVRKTQDKESIPPNAFWVSEPVTEEPPADPQIKTLPVLHLAASEPAAATYDNLVLYFYTSRFCHPCQIAKSVVAKLKAKGYNIQTVDMDTDAGKKSATEQNVKAMPTFILQRYEENTWIEKTRWEGVGQLEQRIKQAFSKYAQTPTGILRPKKSPPSQVPQPGEKLSTEKDENDVPGNVTPLLEEYGAGSLPPAPKKENQEAPKTDGNKGNQKEEGRKFPFGLTPPTSNGSGGESSDSSNEKFIKGFGGRLDKMASETEAKLKTLTDRITQSAIERMENLAREKARELEPVLKEKLDQLTRDATSAITDIAKKKVDEAEPVVMKKMDEWLLKITPWIIAGVVVLTVLLRYIADWTVRLLCWLWKTVRNNIPVMITWRKKTTESEASEKE